MSRPVLPSCQVTGGSGLERRRAPVNHHHPSHRTLDRGGQAPPGCPRDQDPGTKRRRSPSSRRSFVPEAFRIRPAWSIGSTSGLRECCSSRYRPTATGHSWKHSGRPSAQGILPITAGHPNPKRGLIDLALRRTSLRPQHSGPARTPARTRYETRERFATSALVVAEPLTGRMHQIRAHLAARGTGAGRSPVRGAELRGFRPRPPRLCLHAWRLRLPPELSDGEPPIECLLPEELEHYLDRLRGTGPSGARAPGRQNFLRLPPERTRWLQRTPSPGAAT